MYGHTIRTHAPIRQRNLVFHRHNDTDVRTTPRTIPEASFVMLVHVEQCARIGADVMSCVASGCRKRGLALLSIPRYMRSNRLSGSAI